MTLVDVFSLLGGVGLFLFGMTIMSSGLKNACGDNLQNILEKATKNKIIADADPELLRYGCDGHRIREFRDDESVPGHRRNHGREYRYDDYRADYCV